VNYLKGSLLLLFLVFISISGMLSANDLIHMVGKGETIYSISRFYSVSIDELMKANNITNPSKLQAGSRIKIPSSASSQASSRQLIDYRIVKGDTLYSIAQTNEISLQSLLDINKFTANHIIKAGDVIKVPVQKPVSTAQNAAAVSISTPAAISTEIYSLSWPVKPKNISYMIGQMGVVVEGEKSESVKSLTQGKVISAGPWRKFGRVVIVETSGGYFYMYGGCDILSVNVGDRISQGTEVGRLGINTVSEKPQLFFMVFRNDTPVDPAMVPRTAPLGAVPGKAADKVKT
jgi:murein DD-endopeptidase MepM/ murein hydrolase activator NlpD